MKARPGFSLAIAAAITGAAAGYFFRSPVVVSEDRLLANVMTSLCPMDYERPMDYEPNGRDVRDVLFTRLEAMENDWVEEKEKFRYDFEVSRCRRLD